MASLEQALPLKVMEVAYWGWLNSHDEYVALGLKEYRTYDGRKVPFNTDKGRWSVDHLPAYALELERFDKLVDGVGRDSHTLMGYKLIAVLKGILVFRGGPRDEFENGLNVLRKVHDSQANVRAGIDRTLISNYLFEVKATRAVGAKSAPGVVAFWEADVDVELWAAQRSLVP